MDLNTAERLALESSPVLFQSREEIQLSALQNKLNLRSFLPRFNISFTSNRITNMHSSDSDSRQLSLKISQPVFNGGRNIEALRMAGIQLNLQAAAIDNGIEELRDSVWQLFFGLLLNEEKLKLQRELINISLEQLTVTAKKYEMGALMEIDYLEAAIGIREMELNIMDTETEAENLTQDFAVLLGFDHHYFEENPLELKGSLDREYPGLQLWEDDRRIWEQIALHDNPDLKKKRVELEQIKTEYEIMKRALLPAISIDASLTLSGTGFPLQEPGGSLSLAFEFPYEPAPTGLNLGSGFQNSEQISQSAHSDLSVLPDIGFILEKKTASLQLKHAAEGLETSETTLIRSIRSTLRKLEQMRLRLAVLRSNQGLQKKRLTILEKRNTIGEVTESELLEARIEYYGEEISLLEEVMVIIQAERSFEKMIGAGFGELEELSSSIHKNTNTFIRDQ